MRDASFSIQAAVFAALSGIIVDGEVVPVYDEMAAPNATFPRILLLDISSSGGRIDKCTFGSDWSQVIKVSTSFPGRVTKKQLSEISDEILSRLVPFRKPFLDIGPDFNVYNVDASIEPSQSYTDGVRQYIDKNLRITYSITEN